MTYSKNVYKKDGFTCQTCREKHGISKPKNKYSPAGLPKTAISSHIEQKVNEFLNRVDQGGEHGKVHVRTLFIGKKTLEILLF